MGCCRERGSDRSFRGQDPLRNSAAGELSVTTGMRLREFSSRLDIEVGRPRRDASPAEVKLQATAKYGLPRVVMIQDATLRELDFYRRTERAAVVAASAPNLWRHRAELFAVDDVDLKQMKLRGRLNGRRRTFRVEAMPAELRRITVIEGDRGLEAMGLFVGRGGRMLSKQRWEQILGDAHARALRISAEFGLPLEMPARLRIHDLRHTFAIYMLQMLAQAVLEDEIARVRAGGSGGGGGLRRACRPRSPAGRSSRYCQAKITAITSHP